MSDILDQLSKRLQLNDLIAKHLTDIEELIIVPHLVLHLIPFAALPLSDSSANPANNSSEKSSKGDEIINDELRIGGQKRKPPSSKTSQKITYLCEKFRLRIVPSLQILNYCYQRPPIDQQLMGLVEDATSDLSFTTYECDNIANLYQVEESKRLKGNQATTNNYKNLVRDEKINLLHSSHHASFNPQSPLDSQLILADGSLTVGQLIAPSWRLPNLVDVFLSCCETNVTTPEVTDNILTIASGFLCAGARSVVSTQWAVDDLATALFCIFYYRERQKCNSRSQALYNAQKRLRYLKGDELKTQYKSEIEQKLEQKFNQATDKEAKDKIKRAINNLERKCRDELPFEHSVYWSGFISQGLD